MSKLALLLLSIMLVVACRPISLTNQPKPSPSLIPPSETIPIAYQTYTRQPSPTSKATPEITMTPTQTASEYYCEQLLANYHPAEGFQNYCDTRFGFAFDYPDSWTNVVSAQWPDNSLYVPPTTARKMMVFHTDEDMSNFIYIRTYNIYDSTTFQERVEDSLGYNDRAFPDKSYPTLVLGGYRAYVWMECSPQAYNSVHLYFQHGQYYTDVEVKEIDRIGLDTNWQIAKSIQTPGYPPEKNVIPKDLIDDSYKLLTCYVPPYPIYQVTP